MFPNRPHNSPMTKTITWRGKEYPVTKPSKWGGTLHLVWGRNGEPVYVTIP